MRVLAIYPGVDIRFDDIAYALIQLRRVGVELAVVTSLRSGNKTEQVSSENENMEGVSIHRIFRNFDEQTSWPVRKHNLAKEIVTRSKPDLIFLFSTA